MAEISSIFSAETGWLAAKRKAQAYSLIMPVPEPKIREKFSILVEKRKQSVFHSPPGNRRIGRYDCRKKSILAVRAGSQSQKYQ